MCHAQIAVLVPQVGTVALAPIARLVRDRIEATQLGAIPIHELVALRVAHAHQAPEVQRARHAVRQERVLPRVVPVAQTRPAAHEHARARLAVRVVVRVVQARLVRVQQARHVLVNF